MPELNLLVVRVQGALKFEELVWHPQVFMADPQFKSGLNILYDMSEVEQVDGDLELLYSTMENLSDPEFIPVPAKTVFLIGAEDLSLKRIFSGIAIMSRDTRVQHFVYSSFEESLAELAVDIRYLADIQKELSQL